MSRYLLDTNIVSLTARRTAPSSLLDWMVAQPASSMFISVMTLAEIHKGILQLPAGRKRDDLTDWFQGPRGLGALFPGRILPFDDDAALSWARLIAEGRTTGRPRSPIDMIIAATARVHRCILVTDNERDFWGIDLINPVRPPP